MVGSIVRLLVIGVAACVGTHRNRFPPVPRAHQRPTIGGGPVSSTIANEQNAVECQSSDPRVACQSSKDPAACRSLGARRRITDGGQETCERLS
jgi:hypothetical protein